jgi:hypothetical protein
LIWSTKNWNQKDHKSLRINIEYDHARFIKWSPDCKAFIVHKAAEKVVEVYKVAKKPDGWISSVTKAHTFLKVRISLCVPEYRSLVPAFWIRGVCLLITCSVDCTLK